MMQSNHILLNFLEKLNPSAFFRPSTRQDLLKRNLNFQIGSLNSKLNKLKTEGIPTTLLKHLGDDLRQFEALVKKYTNNIQEFGNTLSLIKRLNGLVSTDSAFHIAVLRYQRIKKLYRMMKLFTDETDRQRQDILTIKILEYAKKHLLLEEFFPRGAKDLQIIQNLEQSIGNSRTEINRQQNMLRQSLGELNNELVGINGNYANIVDWISHSHTLQRIENLDRFFSSTIFAFNQTVSKKDKQKMRELLRSEWEPLLGPPIVPEGL